MARIIDGALTGKIGNMVAYRTKDGVSMRKRPKRTAPLTEGEQKNRHIFKLVSTWLNPIRDFVKQGFRDYHKNFQGQSAAVSHLYKTALQRDGYESTIDPALVQVSFGSIGLPEEASVELNDDRELLFSWSPEVDGTGHPRDRAMLLAYHLDAEEANWNLSGPERHRGSASLDLKLMPLGAYQVYLAFMGYNGKGQSESIYLGEYST